LEAVGLLTVILEVVVLVFLEMYLLFQLSLQQVVEEVELVEIIMVKQEDQVVEVILQDQVEQVILLQQALLKVMQVVQETLLVVH
tara:strand:+ start:180 stop:434 length:255 start_codon:yes stop_codon:yes gene_type:complete